MTCSNSSPVSLSRHNRSRCRWIAISATVAAIATAAGMGLAFSGGSAKHPLFGDTVDRVVPPLSLENADDQSTSLAAYRGRIVVLSPFLTLCHEVCPLTTGAFQKLQGELVQAHLARKVVFVEVSVDPWRDTPARLRAFARMTLTRFPLLTGTRTQLARFWHFFGVAYWRSKEGRPADTDWLGGKPLAFDVSHTDGLFLIDTRGRERIVDVGMPDIGAHLPRALMRLLNTQGHADLVRPQPGWTLAQVLDDLERLLGQKIPRI